MNGAQRVQVLVPLANVDVAPDAMLSQRTNTVSARIIGVTREIDLALLKFSFIVQYLQKPTEEAAPSERGDEGAKAPGQAGRLHRRAAGETDLVHAGAAAQCLADARIAGDDLRFQMNPSKRKCSPPKNSTVHVSAACGARARASPSALAAD